MALSLRILGYSSNNNFAKLNTTCRLYGIDHLGCWAGGGRDASHGAHRGSAASFLSSGRVYAVQHALRRRGYLLNAAAVHSGSATNPNHKNPLIAWKMTRHQHTKTSMVDAAQFSDRSCGTSSALACALFRSRSPETVKLKS